MRILILFLIFNINAFADSIIPGRLVTPLVDIFNSKNKEVSDGVQVRVTTYDEEGNLKRNGAKLLLQQDAFENFKAMASSVYRMENKYLLGSAFHIGHNLVLTNFHVLDKRKIDSNCRDFNLLSRDEEYRFTCRKVHFCHAGLDVCLIEMNTVKFNKRCFLCRKREYEISLTKIPHLRLKSQAYPHWEDEEEILTAIGNSKGLGIHVSQGRGMRITGTDLYFAAPITGGNSGGALLNDEGLVVGVVWGESVQKVGEDFNGVYSVATTSQAVIELARERLQNDPETLHKFNLAVVE